MSGNRFLVLSLWLAACWFNNGQNQAQASAILQDDVNILKTQLTQLVQRLDLQERRNLQLEEKLQQQKEEFSVQLQEQTSQLQEQKTAISQLQQQKDEFSFQLQEQKTAISQLEQQLKNQHEESEKQKETTVRLEQQLQTYAENQRATPQEQAALTSSRTKASTLKNQAAQDGDANLFRRSDDLGATEAVISQMSQQMTTMTSEIQVLKNVNTQQDARIGTSYVRWGHTGCPSTAELVYTGIVAGTKYTDNGGASNHLCLTTQPNYDNHPNPTLNGHAYIYGSEYEICSEPECNLTPACAACRISHGSAVMIPGTTVCPTGWTTEYSGHIMADYNTHSSSEYICVDASNGNLHDSQNNDDQNLLYYVVSKCGALLCPPYVDEKIVTCVVCSK